MDTTEHLPPPPTAPSADTRLLAPTRLSALNLAHHLVLAPLTRLRAAHPSHVPSPFAATYYAQRAAVPGTLLITEATFISARAGGYNRVPGLWSDAQIAAWKAVVDAVHARGSFIFPQLWALGRAARPDALAAEGFERVSASDVPLASASPDAPRPLTIAEIKEYVADYANAARRAVHEAGFDGVEVHGANGYLIDQFLQDVTNIREDDYGGSVEKRCRFGLEVVKACCEAVGEERVGIRLSPWSEFQEMRMKDPLPTFTYFVRSLRDAHPRLAYIHLTEPRVMGSVDRTAVAGESNDVFREIWHAAAEGGKSGERAPGARKFIRAGGFSPAEAVSAAEAHDDLVAFGRFFISNPDLPARIAKGLPLTHYDRRLFYSEGEEGYITYPFADAETEARHQALPIKSSKL